jgi:hypothetical protein
MSLVGIVAVCLWDKRRNSRLMLLWILACFLTFTFLYARAERYIIYIVPAFAYFAAWPAMMPITSRPARALAITACIIVLGFCGWQDWRNREYPHLSGYSHVARWLSNVPGERQVLLFDSNHNGNFIFYMRVYDRDRRFVVMRKGLYVTKIIPQFGAKELVRTPEEIQQLLSHYGIKYIAVSDDFETIIFDAQRVLRDLLAKNPQFKLVRKFPIVNGYDSLRHTNIVLYENLQAVPASASQLVVPMMTLGEDIVVPMDEIGNP